MHADCEREPIAFPERIQSFGFLLAVTDDWIIARASANLCQFLAVEARSAIGIFLDRIIPQPAMHHLRYRVAMPGAGHGIERIFGLQLTPDGELYDLAFHLSGDLLIIEGEPCGSDEPMSAATLVRSMIGQIQSHQAIDALYVDAAKQVRAITGFDRVLVYRLADDRDGEVIAESAKPTIDPLLGLHYPAADIPRQAQSLYLRNPFRIIADVASTPVALISSARDGTAPAPLDLSFAVTRAISPIHIEYLRNMGVAASLSISIIVDGKLWGLFTCHHFTPRLPNFVMRSAAELFGAMFSLTLERRLHAAKIADDERNRVIGDRIATAISVDATLLADPAWWMEAVRETIACDGVALSHCGAITMAGAVPGASAIATLIETLDAADIDQVFVTDHLDTLLVNAEEYSGKSAGMLAIPIARVPRDYLLLFRKERIEQRRWGGDPEAFIIQEIDSAEGGTRTHPRTSFRPFLRSNAHHSLPFVEVDRRAGELIRAALGQALLQISAHDTAQSKHAAERQDLVIAELNHRVRNILALIRGLIGQTAAEGVGTLDYVEALGGRVQALARAYDHATRADGLSGTLIALLDDEIAAFVPTRRDRFTVIGPAVRFHARALSTLALVIHELVTNSVKHGAFSADGVVELRIETTPDGVRIAWQERAGPPTVEPLHHGFGSVIIERMIPFDLQGRAWARYPSTGFEADFFVPACHVAGETDMLVATPIQASSPEILPDRPLDGLSVLLLEDDMIVALEAEDLLRKLGAAKIGIAADLVEAEDMFDRGGIDLVMLDIGIGEFTSANLARRLNAASIPFFFATGYSEHPEEYSDLSHIPVLSKPYNFADLKIAATQSLRRHGLSRE